MTDHVFTKGMRVRLTPDAVDCIAANLPTHGTVAGNPKPSNDCVGVIFDGYKTATYLPRDYFRPA